MFSALISMKSHFDAGSVFDNVFIAFLIFNELLIAYFLHFTSR